MLIRSQPLAKVFESELPIKDGLVCLSSHSLGGSWEPELPIKSSSDRRTDVLISPHSLVDASEPELPIKNLHVQTEGFMS